MTNRRIGRSPILLVLIAMSAAVAVVSVAPIRAQTPPAAGPPAAKAAGHHADSLAELKHRAREDLSLLDAKLKAKSAQVREADLRLKLYQGQVVDVRRKRSKGYLAEGHVMNAELSLSQAGAERESRSAELLDIQLRQDRAKRRLARAEQGLPELIPLDLGRTTVDEPIERLQYEMEQARRLVQSVALPAGN